MTSDSANSGARDAHLVSRTLDGDRGAFGELVLHYQRRVFAVVYRYLANPEDAADVTQRTFLKAFENLGRLKRRASFAPWIVTMASNLAKNEIRFRAGKEFRDIDQTPVAVEARGETRAIAAAQRRALRSALARLPEKQRQCVLLRIDGELPFRQIGEAVGCSEVSARVNYHHALRALRDMLGPGAPKESESQ